MARLLLRSFFSLFLLVVLGLGGCKKEGPTPEAATQALLVGRWALVDVSGGFGGGTFPADPAQRREIIFTATSQVVGLRNGVLIGSARYSLYQADATTGTNKTFLRCSGLPDFVVGDIVQVSAAHLYLSDNNYDGFCAHYIRR
jgi:hypothetical protein